MATNQGLLNIATNLANILQPKSKALTSAAKSGLFTLPTTASAPSTISYQNMATGQSLLESLMNQISSNVGSAATKSPFTNSLDLGSIFKNTFTFTGYQQSTPFMTPELVARQSTNLVSGIFQQAVAANGKMTQIQKTQLFSTLLNGVNIGFAAAKKAIQDSGQPNQADITILDQAQEITRQSLYNYYSTITNMPTPQSAPQEATVPSTQATPVMPTPQKMADAAQAYSGQPIAASEQQQTSSVYSQPSIANIPAMDITYRFNAVLAYINLPYIPGHNAGV
jgi:hypothetical protein